MRIALITKGELYQDKKLQESAIKKGHQLDFVYFDNLEIGILIDNLKNYDLIYWRIGNAKIRDIVSEYAKINNITFVNSAYITHIPMHAKSFQLFRAILNKIPIPETHLFTSKSLDLSIEKVLIKIGIPCILKQVVGAKGAGVWKVGSADEVKKLVQQENLNEFLLQKYIENDGDYRVLVIGNKAIGIFKRIPKSGDFKANISLGGSGEIVDDENIKNILFPYAETIASNLEIEIAGIDFIREKSSDRFFMIETNSIPQWEGFEKTTGINVADKIIEYFEILVAK